MTYRGSDNQTITWDAENRPVMVSENGTVVATFIYDGDGNRVKKTEAGETVLYVNKYYEKNLTSGNVTTSYYLGSRLIAQREGEEVRFLHQDHLSGTSLTTSDNGTVISSITYFPYGDTRGGDVPTDVKFTGQRLDSGTGLYYYGARYYDPLIGRFISADTIIPDPMNPQAFNRYTYCLNNPLKYVDPSGHIVQFSVSTNIDGLSGADLYCALLGIGARIQTLNDSWEALKQEELDYTKHMEDSVITFNVIDIDVVSQIITYDVEMKGEVKFDEPVQLQLVQKDTPGYRLMETLEAGGMSPYPGPILIRTDIGRTTEVFTQLVAHESYHRWEQINYGWAAWLANYAIEYIFIYGYHDLMPSEIRAIDYENEYYSSPPSEGKIIVTYK